MMVASWKGCAKLKGVRTPRSLSPFVGRLGELAAVRAGCRSGRLVTVVGPGGCGKTRLAVEAVAAREFAVCGFVELASVPEPRLLGAAVLAGCDIRDEPGREPVDRLVDRLRESCGVLVLDTCEHLRAAVVALAAAVLNGCPAITVLVTTRIPLGCAGETLVPLAGLDPHTEGRALFLDRVRRLQPGVGDRPEVLAQAATICELADGLPLAIELAAARARTLPLAEIRAGMGDRLAFLTARYPDPERHRSLGACIEWSYRLATPAVRAGLCALSVLPGRFTLDAAVAVSGGRGVVEDLVDQSLVQFTAGEDRYVLLDTIREFAAKELAAADERAAVGERLLGWVSSLATREAAGLAGGDPEALRRVDRDIAAVRAALDFAADSGRGLAAAAQIVADLAFFWSLRGRCAEGARWAQRVLAAMVEPPCALVWAAAFLAVYDGAMELGAQLAGRAAERAAAPEDAVVRARALTLLGMVTGFAAPDRAEPMLVDAVGVAQTADDRWAEVEARQCVAYAHLWRCDPRAAVAALDAATAVLQGLGHEQLLAWDAAARADAAAQAGRFAEAVAAGHRGQALAQRVGEPVSAAGALWPLTLALASMGRVEEAARVAADAQAFFAAHPGLSTRETLLVVEGLIALWRDPGAAVGELEPVAATLAAGIGGVWAIAAAGMLATARLVAGDPSGALAASAEAARAAGSIGHRGGLAQAALVQCAAERMLGPSPDALQRAHAALADAAERGLLPLVADGLDVLAGLTLDGGRALVAARLAGAAHGLRGELGAVASPLASWLRAGDRPRLAELLGPGEWERAEREGGRLNVGQAMAYAARARGRRGRPRTGWNSLTPTEREVIALVASGLSNSEVGRELLMTEGTVRTHLRSVFGKLGVSSRAELAAAAARQGL